MVGGTIADIWGAMEYILPFQASIQNEFNFRRARTGKSDVHLCLRSTPFYPAARVLMGSYVLPPLIKDSP